jgi:hypothetical protein
MADVSDIASGTTISGESGAEWTVAALIGRGGTAVVYAVDGPRGEKGAAKLLSGHRFPVTEAMRERFERERRHLSTIEHPHVLRVLDSGLHDSEPVLVCERMEGSLYERIEAALPVDQCVAWLAQAIAGLMELHARGMVHRDLSPKNLLLRPDERLVVADFGTVRHLDDPTVTASENLGSLLYISPQQFDNAHSASPSDDLYSIGQIAWHLLIGRPPQGNTPPVQALRHDVPVALSQLVEGLRAYDEAERPKANDALSALIELTGVPPRVGREGRQLDKAVRRAASAQLGGPVHANAGSGRDYLLPFRAAGPASLAPLVEFELRNGPAQAISDMGLVDTGADYSLFPLYFMEILDISRDECQEHVFEGSAGSGSLFVAPTPLTISILGQVFSIEAKFGDTPIPLLGRNDVLAHFEVTIDQRRQTVRLKPVANV